VAGVALVVAAGGCAGTPLPGAQPLRGQSPPELAWDSRTCAWSAQDVSGYDRELSQPENDIVEFFTHGPRARSERGDAGAVTWPTADFATIAASPGGTVPSELLGRGGRKGFDQAYERCMTQRGYQVSGPAEEGKAR
jgi:hypothetical protein